MITLYQPPAAWGLPSVSPFCVKLETYLRMAGLQYGVGKPNVFKEAPNGRVPYVKIDGHFFGDSTLIIRELKKRFGDSLDRDLSSEQRAQAVMLQSLVEDHLYFAGACLRWSDEESWGYVRDYFKPLLPKLLAGHIVKVIRKDAAKIFRTQGMGEHSRDEIVAFAKADLTALSDYLGNKPFFLGERPTSVDATIYGFLVQLLWVPWNNPIKQHGLSLKNLTEFCERMKQKFWN